MTVREHIEAIRDRHYLWRWVCAECARAHPCGDYRDAVAALAIIDSGTRIYCDHLAQSPHLVVIPDPVPS